jgi:hypothetical protein
MESNGPKRCKFRNKKENLDGLVTHLEKMMEKYQRLPYNKTLREAGKEEDQKIFGEDRLLNKRGEVEMN